MLRSVSTAAASTEVTSLDDRSQPKSTGIDREREWLGLVAIAFGRSGLTHKAAAAELEMDPGLLSRQLSGVANAHLSFRRMWKLPPEFWQAMAVAIAEFYGMPSGMAQQDAEDIAVGRMFREAVQRVRR